MGTEESLRAGLWATEVQGERGTRPHHTLPPHHHNHVKTFMHMGTFTLANGTTLFKICNPPVGPHRQPPASQPRSPIALTNRLRPTPLPWRCQLVFFGLGFEHLAGSETPFLPPQLLQRFSLWNSAPWLLAQVRCEASGCAAARASCAAARAGRQVACWLAGLLAGLLALAGRLAVVFSTWDRNTPNRF